MKKFYLFIFVVGFLFLTTSCLQLFPLLTGGIEFYVTDYNSGAAVEGASVKILDESGGIRGEGVTDTEGKVTISSVLKGDEELLDVVITKSGYAVTRIEGLKLTKDSTTLNEAKLRVASVGVTKSLNPIEVDVKFFEDATKATPVDLSNVTGDVYVSIIATGMEYDVSIIYAKAGNVPGSGFLTSPRLYVSNSTTVEGTITVAGFEGETPIYVVVFDKNDNMLEKIFYANINKVSKEVKGYEIEKVSEATGDYNLAAYTRRGGIKFYGGRDSIFNKKDRVVPEFFKKTRRINAAPEKDTNLWIEVYWVAWENSSASSTTDEPEAYRVYRSFDGTNYEAIATVPSGYDYYRDASPQLEVGKETWYGVAAVYPGYEATMVKLGSVVPLDVFEVKYISPTDGATNVSRDPVFSWEIINPVKSSEGNPVYYWDIWLYDETLNDYGYYSLSGYGYPYYSMFITEVTGVSFKFSAPPSGAWWVDFGAGSWYSYNELQANKTYEWGNELMVAVVEDATDNTVAYSIHTDLGKRFDPFSIEPEIYNTFTTGEN
ncbi:hypothetical protein JYK00_05470 [Thermosipho ferrireducens]|uniref:Carboxypeptidase regulatory-like domain-containing protein n=1 Tax=Thermosipho ferrireducens TaxID=2571116 RepID=A0ABX7S7V9_9BACT|nr:carboxypeptidase-like regulatory domain-containing protein [Thermosipho ferrireducens]QTA37200.1 hypothetical protein JYK00_05470 [Thermosipho ferrireducens]